jgi:sugar phosphate permease
MTMFAGNMGAVVAGAPLAWLVTQASWRTVFVGLAALSALLALASGWWVRDRPEDAGLPAVNAAAPSAARLPWMHAVLRVLANQATWPAFFVNVGVGGSYLTFAGLWAVPFLQQTRGMSRVDAAQHTSLLLLGVAVGSLSIGLISDRLQSRRGVMRAFVLLYLLSWLPWILHADWPLAATLGWFLLMGMLVPGFTLSWTIAKEANPVEFAGIATAVVNVGIFLGTGVLQPLVGWVLDRGRAVGDVASAWDHAILVMAGAAALGAIASFLVGARRAPAKP